MGTSCVPQGVQLVLCDVIDDRTGGVQGRREFQEGGDICIHVDDSFHCTTEISTTL